MEVVVWQNQVQAREDKQNVLIFSWFLRLWNIQHVGTTHILWTYFLIVPVPASFSFFGTILQQIKLVHPISCAGIRTHDLLNTSLLP